jgi:hypothetical protein
MGDFGPLVPKTVPLELAPSEIFLAMPTVARADAERVLAEELDGVWRPADLARAEKSPLQLYHLPFWRIEASADGFHFGVSRTGSGLGGLTPTGGARSREAVILLPARRHLPFDPTDKLAIDRAELIPRSALKAPRAGDVLAADVPRAEAEREACERLRRSLQSQDALFNKYEAKVRATTFCQYPLWVQRYRYRGEASDGLATDECYVAISARTGKVVSARHPSAFRAVAAKIKKWFD